MDPATRVTEPSLQEGDRFRLGALVRSDSLPQLLSFAGSIPGLAPLLKDIAEIGVVLDAQIVQQELRWRVRRRKKPDARTGLHEAIASGVIVPFAPTFLDSEIEEHLADIAESTSGIEDVRREWQDFRKSLHFYSPKQQSNLTGAEIVDADDLAYIAAADELGLPIYSQDRHYRQMQAPVISVMIDGTAQAYARSSSVRIAVMMGSNFTMTLSFDAIAAACRGIKQMASWFEDLHPGIQLAIIAAGVVALAHPKSQAKLASVWNWIKETVTPTVLQLISEITIQMAEAYQTERETHKRLKASLPATGKRSALMHARAVCAAARMPRSLAEIEKRMRANGYVSRARHFGAYLRRELLSSGQFQESSPGLWAVTA